MARAEVRTCEVCGQKFDGYSTSRYCRECRLTVQKENQRRAVERFRAAEAQARAKAVAKELAEEEKRRKKKVVPNTEQCEKGCSFWGRISGFDVSRCCHHLLRTGKRRQREGDRCLSFTTEPIEEKENPWPQHPSCYSIYEGYEMGHK